MDELARLREEIEALKRCVDALRAMVTQERKDWRC